MFPFPRVRLVDVRPARYTPRALMVTATVDGHDVILSAVPTSTPRGCIYTLGLPVGTPLGARQLLALGAAVRAHLAQH